MAYSFSQHILKTLHDFFMSLSLRPPHPAKDGSFTLEFQKSGTLILTPHSSGKAVVVSLSRSPMGGQPWDRQLRFLSSAGFDPTTSQALHAGIDKNGSLIYSCLLDEDLLTLPSLEEALRRLIEAHNQL